jgi:hypothetical protein
MKNPGEIRMAKNEGMDHQICKRVCDLSAEQNLNPQENNAHIPNTNNGGCLTLPESGNGPDHRVAKDTRERCNTDHCGPRMLTCSGVPAM